MFIELIIFALAPAKCMLREVVEAVLLFLLMISTELGPDF